MEGRHPITGKPIRILRTETHLYRNRKTLVWLRNQTYTNRYRRWDTIVTDIHALETWTRVLGMPPMIYASLSDDEAEIRELLDSNTLDGVQLLFLRKTPIVAYTKERLQEKGYQNIVCIEEMPIMYPHCNFKFDPTKTRLQDLILAIATLFRLQRVAGLADYEKVESSEYIQQLKDLWNLEVASINDAPEELWLIQQYYFAPKAKREREIRKCLIKNLECPYIDKVLLLNEDDLSDRLPTHEKLQLKELGHRLTYWDVLQCIQKEVPENVIVAFANSDIYLDDTWRLLWSVNLKDKFLSLLRYDEPSPGDETDQPKLFGPRPDSQDTWVVHSSSLKQRNLQPTDFDFEFGRAGCDNAVNLSMLRNKFVVCNPAYSLRTIHVHQSQIRTYNPADCIDKPMYLYLEPTGLHDMQPLNDLTPYEKPWKQAKPFPRPIKGDKQQVKTLCTMLAHNEVFFYDPTEENTWHPGGKEKDTVYEFKNATQTPTGLVFDNMRIMLGHYKSLREGWSNHELSQLVPTLSVPASVAISCPDDMVKTPFDYVLNYLGKVLQLRDAGYKGEFWVPRDGFMPLLREFTWDEETIPIMPRDKDIQAFSKTLYMAAPIQSTGSTREKIQALRSHLRGYRQEPVRPMTAVILQDDDLITTQAAKKIEENLETQGYCTAVLYPSRTAPERIIGTICGASVLIAPLTKKTKSQHFYWLLPEGAKVIELQHELMPFGEGIHEAGAANVELWFSSVPRSNKETLQQYVQQAVYFALLEMSYTYMKDKAKPTIHVPIGQEGFHSHTGDSFREMVELWQEKKYVTIERDPTIAFCWLGIPGETLLYDRPTLKWLEAAPAGERSYQLALMGNPAPTEDLQKSWSFWPRKPKLLEALLEKEPPKTTRTKRLVFYGKIENQVQRQRRTAQDWFTACDDWAMAGEMEPPKYTHEEYLRRLGQAKFALCLAGYGFKCHREIEAMAFGTVPICAPDVDMSNYANPPKEGVHYFRAKDPAGARLLSEQTTHDQWLTMSRACQQWWKENASAEGLWNLTKKLANLE